MNRGEKRETVPVLHYVKREEEREIRKGEKEV